MSGIFIASKGHLQHALKKAAGKGFKQQRLL